MTFILFLRNFAVQTLYELLKKSPMRDEHENPVYKIVGANIKLKRQAKKVNQAELASRLNLSRTSLVNIEQGRQHASLVLLFEISKALGCDLHEIIPTSEDVINSHNRQLSSFDVLSTAELISKSKKGVQDFMEQFTN